MTTTPEKRAFTVRTNAGVEEGRQLYHNVNFPSLSTTTYDAQKALVIGALLEPCLAETVIDYRETLTNTVAPDA